MKKCVSYKRLLLFVALCIGTPLVAADFPPIVTVDAMQNAGQSNWYGTDYRICLNVDCTSYYHTDRPLETSIWGGVVKKYRFDPGFYRISVADGAANSYGGGPNWNWLLQIYVEGDNKGYLLGHWEFYATPEDALAGNIKRYKIIEIKTPGDVWFWYGDTVSGDNLGFMTAKVDQFSVGPVQYQMTLIEVTDSTSTGAYGINSRSDRRKLRDAQCSPPRFPPRRGRLLGSAFSHFHHNRWPRDKR